MVSWPRKQGRARGNVRTACYQGQLHQSALEARRCNDLHLMQLGGLIRELRAHPQPRFDLVVDGTKVCTYVADFDYFDVERDRQVTEDAKGFRTEIYQLKRKLMRACLGIEVEEVRR